MVETKTIILSNGIVIKDSRSIQCGVVIENQDTKNVNLQYSSKDGLHLRIDTTILKIEEILDFEKELADKRVSLIEANLFLENNER